jgi:hypothetical protein
VSLIAYSQLIAIKRWADRGLYAVVSQNFARLSQEEASIMLRIFDHIHTVDRIFQHHLQGIPHSYRAPRSEQVPGLEVLERGVAVEGADAESGLGDGFSGVWAVRLKPDRPRPAF